MVLWQDVSIGEGLNLSPVHKPGRRSTSLLSKFLAAAVGGGVSSEKTHLISLHGFI